MRKYKPISNPFFKIKDLKVGDVFVYNNNYVKGHYVICVGYGDADLRNILNLDLLQHTCEHDNLEVKLIGRFEE